jgi:hypothetical protein
MIFLKVMKKYGLLTLLISSLLCVKVATSESQEYLKPRQTEKDIIIQDLKKETEKVRRNMNYRIELQSEQYQRIIKELQDDLDNIRYNSKSAKATVKAIQKHLAPDGVLYTKSELIYKVSTLYNVSPKLVTAIMIHETDNGRSKAIKTKNNVGGIMHVDGGGLQSFDSVDVSIAELTRLLKRYYIDQGLTDIPSIGAKYCPVGAENDPENLNQYWIPKITKLYNSIHLAEKEFKKELGV